MRGCDALLCLLTERVDEELLSHAGTLRIVSNMAVGVDNIDVAACTARRIWVGHTPGVLTQATADFTFALLLASARHIVSGDAFVRSGAWKQWDPNLMLGLELSGATLGIIGLGAIGQAVATRAQAFGMNVLGYNRRKRQVPGVTQVELNELLERSDVVSLHIALTPDTRGLLGEREFARMKPGSLLVNTARGGLMDADALATALLAGRPGRAALDVFEPEPPNPAHPLLSSQQVVLAPHLGSATEATRLAMARLAANNIVEVLGGRAPRSAVNALHS